MGLRRARLGETPRGPLLHPTGKTHTVGAPPRWGTGKRQKGAIGHPRESSGWATHRCGERLSYVLFACVFRLGQVMAAKETRLTLGTDVRKRTARSFATKS